VTALDELAGRVAGGDTISGADAQVLLDTPDLIAVGSLADDVRRRMHGRRTTFVRVFEVHAGAPPASLPDGVAAGEFRIVGRPADLAMALEAVRTLFRLAAGAPVTGFALSDLQALASDEQRPLDEIVAALRDAGLEAIADVPLDMGDAAAAVETARGAGLRVERLTVHDLPPESRIAIVERARDLQALVGGLRVFAPLARTLSAEAPTTGYEDVKQVAIARLVAANIPSIQVDWPLYGPKLAQVALTVGADDVDGVAAFDPVALGARRSALEDIRRNIHAAALDPVERDGRFAEVDPPSPLRGLGAAPPSPLRGFGAAG
jgi:aminodeoxyfutalosine synthase